LRPPGFVAHPRHDHLLREACVSTVYEIFGPLEVPTDALKGKAADMAAAREAVFADEPNLGARNGVYFFGLQTARGLAPVFMGTSLRGFSRDVFRAENVRAYLSALKGYSRVKAVLLLVARPAVRGRVPEAEIAAVAQTLFAMASNEWKELTVLGEERPDWSIKGVLRSGPGRLSRGAMDMRRILGVG
jgi:hypothetical protein